MMPEKVKTELQKKEPSEFHKSILDHAKKLVKKSRSDMSKHYDDWDLHDKVFRGERIPDLEDRQAQQQDKPGKMIVPNTYAQCMTFTSFMFLMLKQNPVFYTFKPSGDEDYGTKVADSELLLEGDLAVNEWDIKLFQSILDSARFGPAILETSWERQTTHAFIVPDPEPIVWNGIVMDGPQMEGDWQEFVKYEGNIVKNVSPYRFFPDTAFPLVEFQKGNFCASEEEYTMADLRRLESEGEVAGVDHIEGFSPDYAKLRGSETRWSLSSNQNPHKSFDKETSTVLVTKLQCKIVPHKYKIGPSDSDVLGPQEFPIMYHVWYANDNRVIRCEPAKNWHGEFGWSVGQFTPDMQRDLNCGLADLIYALQDVISWFINSHITSVRRVIASRLIIDPKVIDTKTLDGEGDIYVRKSMSVPLDRAVGQLKVQDVTAAHMTDAEILNKTIEMVTGVNNNSMGQYNTGRRSAQEARTVTAGSAGRMKMHAHLLWCSLYGRAGRQMHSNQRQAISFEEFQRRVGQGRMNLINGETPEMNIARRYKEFRGTPADVISGHDYFLFDSTLASEKGFIAQSLQELLVAVMSNPQVAMQWDISAQAMMEEIQRLRGAGNISRFSLSRRIASGQEALPQPQSLPAPNDTGTTTAAA